MMNPYDLLRPDTPQEQCECDWLDQVVMVNLLTDNPLHCIRCRKEIEPERLPLTSDEIREIAGWNSIANALYKLWLDSTEYETYAKEKLLDPNGHVNQRGIAAARCLSSKIPTWFWFFRDADDGIPDKCPLCGDALDADVQWAERRCTKCKVYT
jgi:predicted nucleic acid-binding Zn ribbon protein